MDEIMIPPCGARTEGVNGLRTGCVAAFAADDPTSGTERLVVLAETVDPANVTSLELEKRATGQIQSRVGLAVSELKLLPPVLYLEHHPARFGVVKLDCSGQMIP